MENEITNAFGWGLLAIGTAGFVWVTAIALILLFLGVNVRNKYSGSGWFAFSVVVGYIAVNLIMGGQASLSTFFHTITHEPGRIISTIIVYVVIGIVWSIVRWYFFLLDERDEQRKRMYSDDHKYKVPKAKEHKGDITFWMSYWPINAVWTLFRHPLRRFFQAIFEKLGGLYDSMSERIFKTAIEDRQSEISAKKAEKTNA